MLEPFYCSILDVWLIEDETASDLLSVQFNTETEAKEFIERWSMVILPNTQARAFINERTEQ